MATLCEIIYFNLSINQKNILRKDNTVIIDDIEWRILRKILKKFFNRRITVYQQNIINIIKWCNKHKYTGRNKKYSSLVYASKRGYLEVIKYLYEVDNIPWTKHEIDYAASHGHINVIKYLYEVAGASYTDWAIIDASRNGHLLVIKYLHETMHVNCSGISIDLAAWKGHLDVVVYLHEVVKISCSKLTIQWACENKHFKVIKYLCNVVKIPIEYQYLIKNFNF